MTNQALIDKFLHLPPRIHELCMDIRLGVLAAGTHVTTRRVKIGKRPVHEIKIQIPKSEVSKGLLARWDHVIFAVLVIPQLRRDPQLFAVNTTVQNLLNAYPIWHSFRYTEAQS